MYVAERAVLASASTRADSEAANVRQIFILFNTTDATDILLNALAIEFIAELDEEIAAADWWDPERRYIQAGTVELTIRSTLRMHLLEDYREVSKSSRPCFASFRRPISANASHISFFFE
eukprot:scaffold1954_cov268-Pinguiococcus_pyrenoidosus.AAC.282